VDGAGFAFVGRRVPLEVGESDFKVDLLGEVVWRDVAGRRLADADEAWGLRAKQLRANAEEIDVRERPTPSGRRTGS
jgi:hypothetical protein